MDCLRTWKRIGRGLAAAALLAIAAQGPPASANDLSNLPCTAEDVEILGSGVVINEPCICPAGGTFTARVKFTVRNNSNSGRYCVTLHLIPDGVVLTTVTDVILRDANGVSTAPGKKDTDMYAEIPGFPCNLGTVCFGNPGVVQGKCDPGKCTTIGWSTSTGSAGCTTPDQAPPGGQCRHQQICIVGYGATLACKAGCTPVCGDSTTFEACVIAPQSRGPFTLEVQGDDGSALQKQSTVGDASGSKCLSFKVAPTKGPNTTYTLTVRDKDNCTRIATVQIPVAADTATITQAAAPGCNAVATYTASVGGKTGCTFTWTVDGLALAMFLKTAAPDLARIARVSGTGGNTFQFRSLDDTCHSIEVSASCSANGQAPCVAKASTTVKQCGTSQSCQK